MAAPANDPVAAGWALVGVFEQPPGGYPLKLQQEECAAVAQTLRDLLTNKEPDA